MKKLKNLGRGVISIILLITMILTIIPEINVLAFEEDSTSAQTEAQLIEIINRLGEENIIFENAVGIEIGQEVEVLNLLSNYENIEIDNIKLTSNNENILTTVDNKLIIGINEGTTFLIVEAGEKYHVLEVYVAYPIEEIANINSNTAFMNAATGDSEYIGDDFLDVASGVKAINPRNVIYSKSIGSNEKSKVLTSLFSSKTISYNIQSLSTTSSRSQYVVYVDAGHGGADPGAVANGIKEKDINLAIALKVRDKLKALGVQVVMNRETDVFVNFKDTAAHANSVNPDAFVSIHNNSATAAANGIETYYNKTIDLPLANEVQSRMVSYTGAYNRGVKWDEFYVTKYTTMPAILTEAGFVTNPQEAAKLNTNSYQNSLANAITDGVMKYLKDNVILSTITSDATIPSERIYGSTRYETSYKVFQQGWAASNTAVLVTGLDYPDALCAAPLAGKFDAPILLVKNTSLSNQSELRDLLISKGVKNVYIIGGTGVIPNSFSGELSSIGISSKRLGGSNRYDTSLKIAQELGSTTGEVAIAYGLGFVDGLSISSIAAFKGFPILLTQTNSIPESIKSYLNSTNITRSYIVGSEGVVSQSVASQLPSVVRLGGKNRYETNSSIFDRFKSELNISDIYITSALDFPDALSSSALAARTKSFVVLSNTTAVDSSVKSLINSNAANINKAYILGSNNVIRDAVITSLGISK